MKKAIIYLGILMGLATYTQNPINLLAMPIYCYTLYKCYIEFKNA